MSDLFPAAEDWPALIVRLVARARSAGYTVLFRPVIDEHGCRRPQAAGYTSYTERTIQVHERRPALRALTLAHELGHVVASQRMGWGREPGRDGMTGERRAYLYGWAVLVAESAARRMVSRHVWRRHHRHIDLASEARVSSIIRGLGGRA